MRWFLEGTLFERFCETFVKQKLRTSIHLLYVLSIHKIYLFSLSKLILFQFIFLVFLSHIITSVILQVIIPLYVPSDNVFIFYENRSSSSKVADCLVMASLYLHIEHNRNHPFLAPTKESCSACINYRINRSLF